MNLKPLLSLLLLFGVYCYSQTNSGNFGKTLHKKTSKATEAKRLSLEKFVEEACKQIKVLEENFSNVMSSKYRYNKVKLDKAIEYLDKVFDKRAKIEIINSKGRKRKISVREYFTKVRETYLSMYNHLDVSFTIKCDKSQFEYVKDGIVGNITFEQKFTGVNNKTVYIDITIKNIFIRSNTDTYDDGTINYYDVKFTGIKAIEVKESSFSKPIKR